MASTELPELDATGLIALATIADRLAHERGNESPELAALATLLDGLDPLPLPRPLTRQELDAFGRNGWVLLPGLFDDWHRHMRCAVLEIIDVAGHARHERRWDTYSGRAVRNDSAGHLSPTLRAAARFGPSSRIARTLLGPSGELVLRGIAGFVKEPPIAYGSPWHVDPVDPPWPEDRGVHIWVALDDGDAESGAIQLVPGSHRWTADERASRIDTDVVKRIDTGVVAPPSSLTVPGLRTEEDTVAPTFRAGDAIAFDSRMVHGAAGNRTDRTFVSVASMWCAGLLANA